MLRFALLGCGKVAYKHAEILGKGKVKGAELVAVCDIDEEKAKKLASLYGIKYYTDIHELMGKEKIDVVSILTPSGIHAKNVIELSQYGKHMVVEKPMALTVDDADEMILACQRNNCKLFVIKQNRFLPTIQKLKEAINKGRFGKIFMVTARMRWRRGENYYKEAPWRGTWAYDGGVVANQAVHQIDILVDIMGKVDAVFAKGIQALGYKETEDTAAVIFKFRNGGLGILEATTATSPEDLETSISVLGEKGTVEIGGILLNKIIHWKFVEKYPEDEQISEMISFDPAHFRGYGHTKYYEHIIDCILHDKEPYVDGYVGRQIVEIVSAIYESMETRKEIYLRFKPEKCKLGVRL